MPGSSKKASSSLRDEKATGDHHDQRRPLLPKSFHQLEMTSSQQRAEQKQAQGVGVRTVDAPFPLSDAEPPNTHSAVGSSSTLPQGSRHRHHPASASEGGGGNKKNSYGATDESSARASSAPVGVHLDGDQKRAAQRTLEESSIVPHPPLTPSAYDATDRVNNLFVTIPQTHQIPEMPRALHAFESMDPRFQKAFTDLMPKFKPWILLSSLVATILATPLYLFGAVSLGILYMLGGSYNNFLQNFYFGLSSLSSVFTKEFWWSQDVKRPTKYEFVLKQDFNDLNFGDENTNKKDHRLYIKLSNEGIHYRTVKMKEPAFIQNEKLEQPIPTDNTELTDALKAEILTITTPAGHTPSLEKSIRGNTVAYSYWKDYLKPFLKFLLPLVLVSWGILAALGNAVPTVAFAQEIIDKNNDDWVTACVKLLPPLYGWGLISLIGNLALNLYGAIGLKYALEEIILNTVYFKDIAGYRNQLMNDFRKGIEKLQKHETASSKQISPIMEVENETSDNANTQNLQQPSEADIKSKERLQFYDKLLKQCYVEEHDTPYNVTYGITLTALTGITAAWIGSSIMGYICSPRSVPEFQSIFGSEGSLWAIGVLINLPTEAIIAFNASLVVAKTMLDAIITSVNKVSSYCSSYQRITGEEPGEPLLGKPKEKTLFEKYTPSKTTTALAISVALAIISGLYSSGTAQNSLENSCPDTLNTPWFNNSAVWGTIVFNSLMCALVCIWMIADVMKFFANNHDRLISGLKQFSEIIKNGDARKIQSLHDEMKHPERTSNIVPAFGQNAVLGGHLDHLGPSTSDLLTSPTNISNSDVLATNSSSPPKQNGLATNLAGSKASFWKAAGFTLDEQADNQPSCFRRLISTRA